jgi:MFS transporter, PAT family, beta-lactamase induction signal transducer AmpG
MTRSVLLSSAEFEPRKYVVIAALCAAQAFPFGFNVAIMPTVARANGLPTESFWLLSLALVPYWAKVLWAPAVDRYGSARFGRRKSWIVPLTLLTALGLLVLSLVPPVPGMFFLSFGVLGMVLLLITTQDIAFDAYCIESLTLHDFHFGVTVKMVAEAVGWSFATWGLLALYERTDWATMVLCAAVALVALTTAVFLRTEAKPQPSAPSVSLLKFFRRDRLKPKALILLAGGFLNTCLLSVWGPFLVDQGFTLTQVGLVVGGVAFLGELAAAAAANWAGAKAGPRAFKYAAVVCPALILPVVWLASIQKASIEAYAVAGVLLPFVFQVLHVLVTVERMKWSRGSQVATDFTGFGFFYNLGRTAGPAFAGVAVAAIGWSAYMAIVAGGVALFALLCYRAMSMIASSERGLNCEPDCGPTLTPATSYEEAHGR